ncbi:hypothetical protein WEI85_27350 [Actinomycetes bacterium KLBMP 9797]
MSGLRVRYPDRAVDAAAGLDFAVSVGKAVPWTVLAAMVPAVAP